MIMIGYYFFPYETNKIEEKEKEEEKEVKEMYEDKYPLNSEAVELDELKKLQVVEEETPEGKVRMKLDGLKFLYWSNRSIQYKYLETVARKYVLVYDCKEKYNIMTTEIKPLDQPVQTKPSVFASFKQTKQKQTNQIYKITNIYCWKGKILDYDPPKHKEIKNIDYSEFKKLKTSN
jgi:hypothetical protein